MTRGQLEALFATERREARYGKGPDDKLTEAEQKMPRAALQRKLSMEANLRWAQRRHERGDGVAFCETCGRFREPGDNHFCARAPWVGPTQYRSGVPTHQELIVTGNPSGFNVQRRTTVDTEQLAKQWQALAQAQARFGSPVPPPQLPTSSPRPSHAPPALAASSPQPVVMIPESPVLPASAVAQTPPPSSPPS